MTPDPKPLAKQLYRERPDASPCEVSLHLCELFEIPHADRREFENVFVCAWVQLVLESAPVRK